jgi:hypothetical protein
MGVNAVTDPHPIGGTERTGITLALPDREQSIGCRDLRHLGDLTDRRRPFDP